MRPKNKIGYTAEILLAGRRDSAEFSSAPEIGSGNRNHGYRICAMYGCISLQITTSQTP